METTTPLFIYLDSGLRVLLVLFLAFYAIKFKSYLMFLVLIVSSATLYLRVVKGMGDTLVVTLLGEVTAFLLVYMLYEYMRMRHLILWADSGASKRMRLLSKKRSRSKKKGKTRDTIYEKMINDQ